MSELIRVPDLGGEGEVIELLVKVGDRIEADQSVRSLLAIGGKFSSSGSA